jgi:hypothetical protein
MSFEGVLGGWLYEPGQQILLLRAGYQDALYELSHRAKLVFLIESKSDRARRIILECL